MTPQHWTTLQPWLDAALDATGHDREAQLQALRSTHPELAEALQGLLQTHQAAQAQAFMAGDASAPTLDAATLAGQTLGAYTLVSLLGEGGMGSVWLARRSDGRFEGQVAIKLFNRGLTHPALVDRFQREGQILARLTHAHIARLLDAGVAPGGQPYLVLEHVQGQPIDAWADAQQLDTSARLALLADLLAAVAHAHQHLVVHRDIKPSNVMVTHDGQVKLLDFGIAKLTQADAIGDAPLTQQAGNLLSPGWAAPEQWAGQAITPATDVFALGALAHLLLCGRHPFLQPGDSATQVMQKTLALDVPRMSSAMPDAQQATRRHTTPAALRRALRGDLDAIVAKALRAEPHQRYASADALAQDLARHRLHQPVLARNGTVSYALGKFARRHRLPLAVAGASLCAMLALGANAWWRQQQAQLNQARAESVEGLLGSLFEGMSPSMADKRSFTARELLDRGRSYLDANPGFDPVAKRQAGLRMAALYNDIGSYAQALALYQGELAQARTQGQKPQQATALWHLANLQIKTGAQAEAAQTLGELKALSQSDAALGVTWSWRAALLEGELQAHRSDFAGARQTLDRAATGMAGDALKTLELQARLAADQGRAAQLTGDMALARQHLNRALDLDTQRGTAGTVDRLGVLSELATLATWQGRFEEALPLLERLNVEMAPRLGPQSNQLAAISGDFAYAYLRTGRFELARQWAERMRAQVEPNPSEREDFPDLIETRIDLYSGNASQAESRLQALLAAKLADSNGQATARTEPLRRMHAEALLRLGRLEQAHAALAETLQNQTRLSHAQHSSVAITKVLMACLLARRGDASGAQQLWQQAHANLNQSLGPQHPFALAAASYLALTEGDGAAQMVQRRALAQRVRSELGWQDGAQALAQWLEQPGLARDWRKLPITL
jgi:serine/threonine-protein kinase